VTLIVGLSVVLAATFATAHFMRTATAAVLPSTFFAIALLLYVFGAFDALEVGFLVVLTTIAVAVMIALVQIKPGGWAGALISAVSPGIVLFVALAVWTFFLTRNMQLASWDEFSHWGTVVKATFLEHSLSPYNPVDLHFRSYPPALTIHEFFFMKLGGAWHEGTLFWGYQILFYSLFIPFMKGIRWRRSWVLITLLPLLLFTPILTSRSYNVILVDPILGLMFGYCLALVYTSKASSRTLPAQLAVASAFLVLTKDSGTYFAALALILYAWKLLVEYRPGKQTLAWRAVGVRLGIPVLAAVAATLSWKVLIAAQQVHVSFSQPIALTELSGLANGTGRSYWPAVLDAFRSALTTIPISTAHGTSFSLVSWFLVIAAGLLIMEWAAGKHWSPRRDFSAFVVLIVGAVVYASGLLLLYMFRFSEYEATRLASYSRYLGTYWTGAAMFITLVAIAVACDLRTRKLLVGWLSRVIVFVVFWTIMVFYLAPIPTFYTFLRQPISAEMLNRDNYRPVLAAAERAGVTDQDRVWIIAEHTRGKEYWILRYGLMPSPPQAGQWSIGSPKDASDIWTAEMTAAEWGKRLSDEGYDYVLVYRTTPNFASEFGSLFVDPHDIRSNSVFKVENIDETVQLVEVP